MVNLYLHIEIVVYFRFMISEAIEKRLRGEQSDRRAVTLYLSRSLLDKAKDNHLRIPASRLVTYLLEEFLDEAKNKEKGRAS